MRLREEVSSTSSFKFKRASHKRRFALRHAIEGLETRRLMAATDVLTFHNDLAGTGVNATETQLSSANVKLGSFGKLFTRAVDGQVYAQPLVASGINITTGPNTTAGSTGTRNVVFVATEHDSVYAIDTDSNTGGAVLWQRSFIGLGTGTTTGTNINNTLGATAIATVSSSDLGSGDISPEIGITGTPVIDPTAGVMYVIAKTYETIGGVGHYVQRLHSISLANGTDTLTPYRVGDTYNGNTNNTQIYSYGSGDGHVTDPYNSTGQQVVQFNALRENNRMALSLVNGKIYAAWASHGDNGPYHGWVASWTVSGSFTLTGVFNTCPNGGLAGIWQGGGRLSFESDGSAFYFETGNGPSNSGTRSYNAQGFPTDGNYYEAVVKVVADATTTATSQNINGWGMKAADFFIPYNQAALDQVDNDFGSGGPLILPDSAGIAGHPHLLLAAGKEGKIYLIDRDTGNMGKFNATNDLVVNAVPNGAGHNTPTVLIGGSLSTPTYFNGTIYWVSGYSNNARSFTISPSGPLTTTSVTSVSSFGYLPGSPSISSNGTTNGLVWVPDRNTNAVRVYSAATLATELWSTSQKSGGLDAPGAIVKFAVPTVSNGQVYVGTTNSLVVYGLTPPAVAVPAAPVLTATALSSSSIDLNWTDPTPLPNTATGYSIERLIGSTWTVVSTSPAGATQFAVGGLTLQTTYQFRIRGFNGLGNSAYSNTAAATTTSQVAVLDYSAGFAGSTNSLTYSGSAVINGTRGQITSTGLNSAGSIFSKQLVDVTRFTSHFLFQTSADPISADGFTYTIQRQGTAALGGSGGGLGYNGIASSIAIKFDLYDNAGEGPSSTGLYTNGANPGFPSTNLTTSGIDLHNGHIFAADVNYDGTTLTVVIVDNTTGATATQNYLLNLTNTLGGSTAYVGFTGGTGGLVSVQEITSWTFTPYAQLAPAAPSGLGAAPASATSVSLNWTNNSSNQTAFYLDRATDAAFTSSLVTQTLASTLSSYTDTMTGLAPGLTFYYRIRATNNAGSSAFSNSASAAIPLAPPKPSDAQVLSVTSSQVDLAWTDNAGRLADGYNVLRAVNHGAFVLYASLPALNATAPTQYTWSDTVVQPAVFYEYHIQAYNISGYNDFTGTSATTPIDGIFPSYSDVGTPTTAGSSTGLVNGVYKVYGGGTAISGAADQFHYNYTTATGDSVLIARVTGLVQLNVNSMAGVMLRASTAANSVFAMAALSPLQGVVFSSRATTGAVTTNTFSTGKKVPSWVRLIRSGNTFTAWYSTNTTSVPANVAWTMLGTPKTLTMPSAMLAGLAVNGHSSVGLATGSFTGATLLGYTPPNQEKVGPGKDLIQSGNPNGQGSTTATFSSVGISGNGASNDVLKKTASRNIFA